MKYLPIVIAAALLASCGTPGHEDPAAAAASDSADVAATPNTLDLSEHGMPLLVNVPGTGTPPSARMVEEMGYVEVRAGDRFALVITEMQPDFARLKADLERDMLVKNTIVEETPDLLVYRSSFPDEAGVFTHFMQVVRNGGRTFVVEDKPDGLFNESDAKAMMGAVTAKPAL
jgi:hypothetical protein